MSTIALKDETDAAPQGAERAIYRCLDLLIAVPALVLLSPLLALIAVAIRLEGGSAIFRQRRLGHHKRPFTVHKFRTMRPNADEQVHRAYVRQLIAGEEVTHSDGTGRDLYKLAADERITRVGRALRRSSLDELPQIFDVLRGRMSIVGPRPVIAYEAECYPPGYETRFDVKPGLTGLWQVSGRSERTYREMLELDIAWVHRRSVALYLQIVARTLWVLACRRGAA